MPRPHWAWPCSRRLCPPCPHCSGSRLLCQELSKASPGLHAPPRFKPLRFRHSGSPQWHRLCWACVLCTSQVQAAQVMRCLANAVTATYRLPCPCCSEFWTVIILLRRCASCTPRKPRSRHGRGDKSQRLRSPNTRATRTWEGHKTQAQLSLRL